MSSTIAVGEEGSFARKAPPAAPVEMTYNPALDGLRAVAVLVVLAFHCLVPFLPGGFIGVNIFFVLSGYLITTILRTELQTTGSIAIGKFYGRRAFRLWPPLLLMLALYWLAAPTVFPGTNATTDVLLVGLYLSDYSFAFWHAPEFLRHTWSLAVEEHYYIVWPAVLLMVRGLDARRLMQILLIAFILATLWRYWDLTIWSDWRRTYYRFDTRLSGLIIGSMIAIVPWRPEGTLVGWLSIAVLVALALFMEMPSSLQFGLGGLLVDVAAAGLVLTVVSQRHGVIYAFLSWQPLVYLGLLSYSIYLLHYPIVRAMRDDLDPSLTFALVATSSIAIAALSYHWMEKPIREWRRARFAAA